MTTTTHLRAGNRLFAYSWTTGVTPVKFRERKSDNDVLAYALWLSRNGKEDEADRLLERYCSGKNGT